MSILRATELLVAAGEPVLVGAVVAPPICSPTTATQPPVHEDVAQQAQDATALLELVVRLAESQELAPACRTLVAELQSHLGCQRVAVGVRWRAGGPCRLIAVSGIAEVEPHAETSRTFEAAFDEALLHDGPVRWPIPESDGETKRPCQARLAAAHQAEVVLCAPLRTAEGGAIGVLALLGPREIMGADRVQRFAEACGEPLGVALDLVQRSQPGPARRSVRRVAKALPWLRGKWLWAAAALTVAVLCVPAPYTIAVDCELQPVVRRSVAAPFAGEFEKCRVKPGDVVHRGEVLGRMEGRDVRWELAGVIADGQRARKSRDANMALGKTAAAQMDELEAERLEAKRKLLENRLEQLEIRSPIDGIVISGDLERSAGVPVKVGQVLFEVAPLAEMVSELAVPDEEIAHVADGQAVRLQLDSYRCRPLQTQVARIHPRAVAREHCNVFLTDAPLDNEDGQLRPGMKGRAWITTSPRALGWIYFHKPWYYVLSWLGW